MFETVIDLPGASGTRLQHADVESVMITIRASRRMGCRNIRVLFNGEFNPQLTELLIRQAGTS